MTADGDQLELFGPDPDRADVELFGPDPDRAAGQEPRQPEGDPSAPDVSSHVPTGVAGTSDPRPDGPERRPARPAPPARPEPAPVRSGGRPGRYHLVPEPVPAPPLVELDAAQQRVADRVATPGHGPLLVLAGPGTGKTTTLVEAIAARVEHGTPPDRILTLTFSRKAAAELRDRIATRLGRTVEAQSAWTFHAFAYALTGETRAPEDVGRPLLLLSGPEQDVMVRELLAGDVAEGLVDWPGELAAALGTRGFADELRTLLARVRSLGLEPADLSRLAGAASEPRADWAAAAAFLDEYLDVLDARGMLDYPELVHRAVTYAESAEGRALLRGRYDLVVVDEYQDTDPAQERLLRALAGDGRDVVVVGDPDQSIYAFRGAEVRGLLEFRDRFRAVSGEPAEVLTLSVSRRAGATLLQASRALAGRMPLGGAGLIDALRSHRGLTAGADTAPGTVDVVTFPSGGHQVDAVADLLRRAHLDDGMPWSSMAVLVRSGTRSIPALRRALGAAGVPLEVSGDELPLAREPAVRPLLDALTAVADPERLTAELVHDLLLSPLGGADPAGLRQLGRALRRRDHEASVTLDDPRGRLPRPSADLVRDAVADPALLVGLPDRLASPARALGELLAAAGDRLREGGTAHDVLWTLWAGTRWPRRLERAALRGGPAGRTADRDLDAVVALFDLAARDADREQKRGVAAFTEEIAAQQIPADNLAERGVRGAGVRLLTAHRSKGLEWDLVVVADVQEEVWPDLRRRGSLLEADRLGTQGLVGSGSPAELVAEERRLFYVAVTRARQRLVVTAVDSPEDDGQRPSRFLDELAVPVQQRADRARRPLTLTALVAELRSVAADPARPDAVRRSASGRLARLAAARSDDGVPLVPAAHPDAWWGVLDPTDPGAPMYPEDVPIPLSGSSLTSLQECPLRWFLSHEVRARTATSGAQGFGSVVHALAHDVARRDTVPDLDELSALVDRVWDQLAFEASWQRGREREQAQAVLGRFLAWHAAERGRTVLGTEVGFREEIEVGGRTVVLRGSIDRVEIDADGRLHVVDLKTGKNAPTAREVETHPQLGAYQLAVAGEDAAKALPDVARGASVAGAELVFLRLGEDQPKVLGQAAVSEAESSWVEELLEDAVARIAGEDFPPVRCGACTYCEFTSVCPAQDAGRQVVP